MRGLSVLLKQLTVAMIAAASLVNWTAPHTYTGSSAAHHDAGSGRRGTDARKAGALDSTSHLTQADAAQRGRMRDEYERLPLGFEMNRGQADPRVQFISRSDGYDLSISPTEALLTFSNPPPALAGADSSASLLRMKLVGANSDASAVGLEELPYKSNYFIGNDPKKWLANVPSYLKVKCQDVYPGVDLVYYGTKGQLEYDFIVSPGASHQRIRMRFEGADKLSLNDDGDVVIGTATVEVHHRRPVVYQENNGLKKVIAAHYSISNSREVGFEIGVYDADQALIIDPVLSYATYFGSHTGADSIKGVAVDAAGNAYIAGTIVSSDLPTTPGALQPASRLGDAFVTKLNAAGTAVEYVTYLGGSDGDFGESIAVDATGNAYVTGSTSSNDFPTTANAFQSKPPGTSAHPFVAKLNPTGTALVYSTNLGSGDPFDISAAIAVDAAGQATVVGNTSSPRFPVTAGALQPNLNEDPDAFVAKLNSDGSALVYATYLGGNSSDSAACVALDAEGNAYVGGTTFSTNFPTTRRAYQREKKGSDASFVAKISATGDRLAYSTLLGGDFQRVHGIAVDLNGNAYVIGDVSSPNVPTPTTPGAVQPAPAGSVDTFVMKLNNTGSDLVYSTFLGGSGADFGNAIAVDSFGQAYVTGRTFSADFPLMRPLQSRKLGGPLFKSTDGGANWDDVPALTFDIKSLVVDPQISSTLYASTFNDIIKSTDSGATWRVIEAGLSGTLVIDPVRPAILYAMGLGSIHKSTDAGDDWKRLDFPINLGFTLALVIDPKRPDVLYFGAQRPTVVPDSSDIEALDEPSPNVMFKSTDGGASWRPLDFGMPASRVSYLAIDPQMTSTVYAVTDTDGLLKSTDGGASWFSPTVNGRLAVQRVAIDPTNSQTLYAGGIGGIQKSTNGGESWSQTPLRSVLIASITIDPQTPSTLYVGNFDGVYKTTDGGASWRVALDKVFVNAIALDPTQRSTIYAPAAVTSDAFVAKLNATGTALVYSTFLGGSAEDSVVSIATDAHGNAYIAGITYSANLPVTPNAYQPRGARASTGFVMRIADPTLPRITSAGINGKKLLVSGEGFGQGAVITVNNTDLQTQNDGVTPSVLLISKRGGKQIGRGQTVTIRVRNADGQLSDEFAFTRSLD